MFRLQSRTTQRILDLGLLSVVYWLAFLLRFDGEIPFQYVKRATFLWPYVVVLQYAWLAVFRVPSFSWRYMGLREAVRVFAALAAAAATLLALRLGLPALLERLAHAQYLLVPIGVIVNDFALAFLAISGVRIIRRLIAERGESRKRAKAREAVPTLLIGAGSSGLLVAKEIQGRPDLGILPLGFVDDDPAKLGTVLHGLRVLGTTKQLNALTEDYGAKQAIITIANAPGRDIRRIREACLGAGLQTKIIPGIYEILGGHVNLGRIREVSIEDLLRREVVELDRARTSAFVAGRRVLITGAGGSIGAELCRQVGGLGAAQLVLVERAEHALFSVHHELRQDLPALDVVPCLCDVGDEARVEAVFAQYRPQVVFHAAAHKHVPMMEWNPGEAIKNNVFGTRILAEAADRHGVEDFVLISTDKAVNPTSVMGATKRIAEMIVQALAQRSKTNYVAVRFGNVLGSTGSVIPIFKQQIAQGGPVTVTHGDMTRYFMTIPEATDLVLQAAALGQRGEIFLLDMGEPVRILDLAEDLIRLSGLVPHEDIAIELTGVRPGEKLFEELCFDPQTMDRTRHPKIFVVTLTPDPWDRVLAHLERLASLPDRSSLADVRRLLGDIVSEMRDEAAEAPEPAERPAVAG